MIKSSTYGFYEYAGGVYYDKSSALDAALVNQDYNPHIRFNFNDHVFSKIDWETEPDISITDLYKMRAQQLRDEYDYLILMYTGGSDSREVLYSFLNNGVFLDEVVTVHPTALLENTPVIADINHKDAFLFEFNLTTLPGLAEVNKLSPKTTVQIVDMSDDLLKYYDDDNYFCDKQPTSHMGGVYHTIKTNSGQRYVNEHTENKGRVGVIYGCDKPNVVIINDKMFHFFGDNGLTGSQSRRRTNAVSFTPILFFSTAEAPLIPVKQCHLIKNTIEKIPAIYKTFSRHTGRNLINRTREINKHIVYPNWNTNIFQGNKDTHFNFDDCKNFYNRIDPKLGQAQDSRKKSFLEQYGKISIITPNHIYMAECVSKYYYIGDIESPISRR